MKATNIFKYILELPVALKYVRLMQMYISTKLFKGKVNIH